MVEFFTVVLLASLIILVFLLARLWALRYAPGATELLLCSVACGLWAFGYTLEILLPGLHEKLFWAKFEYCGIGTVTVWVLLFILRYTGHSTWFNVKHMVALLVIPTLTLIFTLTNEAHTWMWTEVSLQSVWPAAPLLLEHGWWFWVEIGYSYILLAGATVLLVSFIFRTQRVYFSQSMIMFVAMLAPWLGNALYILGVRPGPNLDLTPIAFTITNVGLVVGFLGFRLLDILPVAYSSIFKFMSDGVVVLDIQHRVVDLNPAAREIFRWLHTSPPTQPRRGDAAGNDPFISHKMQELLPAWASAGETSEEKEIRLNQGQGKISRVYTLKTTHILNKRQQITGYILIFTDITRLKATEEQLKVARDQAIESNRLKTQLLANVSHDMRTPLGAIIGYADMLDNGFFGKTSLEQKNAITDIQDSANQLLLFVNNLIGQAQFDTGKILIRPKPFLTQELLDACRSALSLPTSKKGIRLLIETAPDFPMILHGDLYWLRQIALNLINNALKFTDQGMVKVHFYLPDQTHWAFDVTDTGIGISAEKQVIIFEPFQQVNGSPTRERGGSGLGLAIVKELTSLMGGQVSLVSQPGVGSTFTACFPSHLEVEEKIYE